MLNIRLRGSEYQSALLKSVKAVIEMGRLKMAKEKHDHDEATAHAVARHIERDVPGKPHNDTGAIEDEGPAPTFRQHAAHKAAAPKAKKGPMSGVVTFVDGRNIGINGDGSKETEGPNKDKLKTTDTISVPRSAKVTFVGKEDESKDKRGADIKPGDKVTFGGKRTDITAVTVTRDEVEE